MRTSVTRVAQTLLRGLTGRVARIACGAILLTAALTGFSDASLAGAFPNYSCSTLPVSQTLFQGGDNNLNLTSFSLEPGETLLFSTSDLVDNNPSSNDPKWNLIKSGQGGNVNIVGTTNTFVQVSLQPSATFTNNTGLTLNANFNASIDTGKPRDPKGASFKLTISCRPASPGSLKIIKNVDTGSGTFKFNVAGPSGPFTDTIDTSVSNTSSSHSIDPGTYTISEVPDANYTLSSVSCSGASGTPAPVADVQGNKITLVTSSNDNVTCTFQNVKKSASNGTIIIRKTVTGDSGNFNFTGDLGSFQLAASPGSDGSASFSKAPGSYSVTEAPTNGWISPPSLSCSVSGTGGSTATPTTQTATSTANISLKAGDTVTCIYANTKQAALLQLKKTVDQTKYTDVGQTLTYKIVAIYTGNVPLTNFNITDAKAPNLACSRSLPATLHDGDTVTCTTSYITVIDDITAKCVDNTAVATGIAGGNMLSADDTARVCLTSDKTTQTIHNFIERRVDFLASNEPDRARLMRRFDRPQQPTGSLKDGSGPMKLLGSSDAGSTQFSFATSLRQIREANAAASRLKAEEGDAMHLGASESPLYYPPATPLDVWVEGHFQQWNDNLGDAERSGSFGIMYVGADYLVRPWILIGALIQLDWMDDHSKLQNTDVKGNGWMAGPYASVKISDHIYFDARGAWGQSSNNINPFGTYTDNFDTNRWLVKANLTGDWRIDRLRISPSVGFVYVEETQKKYVDTLGFIIPEQSAQVGRMTFGPEFGYQFQAHDGSIIEPQLSLTGIWDFDGGADATIDDVVTTQEKLRGKIEGGVMVQSVYGTAFRGTISYDGLGTSDYGAWGGQLWVNLPLN